MKNSSLFLLVLLTCITASAQYEKAGFLGKTGRTYEIGLQMNALGTERSTAPGIRFGWGLDREGKRIFFSYDLQLILPYKYGYNSYDE